MKVSLGILFAFTLALPALAMEMSPPPDAGISNEELQKLGRRADVVLAKKFATDTNFRRGILIRMGSFGDLAKPSPLIRAQLISFVEHEFTRRDSKLDADGALTIGMALEVIGQRGGSEGIKYLSDWIYDSRVYGRTGSFSIQPERAIRALSELRRNALRGIGRNGTKESLELLSKIAGEHPKDIFEGSFIGVLNAAMAENRLILKEGKAKHFKSDLVYFTRRTE